MGFQILGIEDFYTAEARFWERVDPTAEEEGWRADLAATAEALTAVLGEAQGRSVLDASCGTGNQALALAQLGWRVTGTDITAHALHIAQERARRLGVAVEFRRCDMREVGRHLQGGFDCLLTCGALDNIGEDGGIEQALAGMYQALRPGGLWYLWLRDLEWVVAYETHYRFKGLRQVPHGQVITIEDWQVESETHVVHVYAHLHEDRRRQFPDEPWHTEAFGYRRRILKKTDLAQCLGAVGYEQVTFLPQEYPWHGYRVTARKPTG